MRKSEWRAYTRYGAMTSTSRVEDVIACYVSTWRAVQHVCCTAPLCLYMVLEEDVLGRKEVVVSRT